MTIEPASPQGEAGAPDASLAPPAATGAPDGAQGDQAPPAASQAFRMALLVGGCLLLVLFVLVLITADRGDWPPGDKKRPGEPTPTPPAHEPEVLAALRQAAA